MRNNTTYRSQRGGGSSTAGFAVGGGAWSRNRNTVRHESKSLGTTSFTVIVAILVLIVGLIYVTQGTKATDYDYKLSEIETQIDELEAQREDLAVERARLTSIVASENSSVAMAMEDAKPAGYAE